MKVSSHERAHRTILHAWKSVHANIKFVEPCWLKASDFFLYSAAIQKYIVDIEHDPQCKTK